MKQVAGIVVALPQEARALFGRLGWNRSGEFPTKAERFQDTFFMVAISGQGVERARRATRFLLKADPIFVLNFGVAGALVPGLKSGDLVIPGSITDGRNTEAIDSIPGEKINAILQSNGIGFQNGLLVTHPEVAPSTSDKGNLHNSTGAIAVDMEAFGIYQECRSARVPFHIVKAITDTVDQTVPLSVTSCLSETGHVKLAQFTLNIICRPWLIPRLIEMQKSFAAAVYSLEQVKLLLSINISRALISSSE